MRLSYLFGPDGPCFPARVLAAGANGETLRLIHDTRISPTSTRQAARVMARLLRQGSSGIYHAAGAGETSPLGFGLRLLAAAGLPNASVESINASDWVAPAQRPPYSVLRPYMLELEGANDLEPWEDEADSFARNWMDARPAKEDAASRGR